MQNKFISALKILNLIALLTLSSQVMAAYYNNPELPDYDSVIQPCQQRDQPSTYHRHHHYHQHKQHKRNSYSVTKYYVYQSNDGDLIWVPSPCDCGTWIKVREIKHYRGFFEKPYEESGYQNNDDNEIDFDMDRRTADDVEDESETE